MPDLDDRFYSEVSSSIKMVFDLTSRIDERVKILVEQHAEACERIDKLMDRQEGIMNRLTMLESRDFAGLKSEVNEVRKSVRAVESDVNLLKKDSQSHDYRWEKVVDWGFKIFVAVFSAFLAWKLSK